MKWTRTPPARSGWYWISYDGESPDVLVVVVVDRDHPRPQRNPHVEWAGPLRPPRGGLPACCTRYRKATRR